MTLQKKTKKITVAVHNGNFHADDVFSVAVLETALGQKTEIFRTRDQKIIGKAGYVLDVGKILEPSKGRFDHHQEGFSLKRKNGIPYATFGLVWKEYGTKICGSGKIAETVDGRLAAPIDATDSGFQIYEPNKFGVKYYGFDDFVYHNNPEWNEKEADSGKIFREMVKLAKKVLKREIALAKSEIEAGEMVKKSYGSAADKRIVVLTERVPWAETVAEMPEPVYVIYPDKPNDTWRIGAVPVDPKSFKVKKDFPSGWAGKSDEELAEVSGVPDAVFCHNGRFLCVAKSRGGAIKLAELALKAKS